MSSINPEPRSYKGWIIWSRNVYGMWSATNYSQGKGSLAADTLAGLKQYIREIETGAVKR